MKKIIIKTLNIFLLLTMMFSPFLTNADEEETATKGDLRCPVDSTTCVEIRDSNGVVTEVRITEGSLANSGDIQITKIVKRTSTLGRYEIQFTVKGNNIEQIEEPKESKIIFIMDTSETIRQKFSRVQTATKTFVDELSQYEKLQVAIIQFGTTAAVVKDFDQDFNTVTFFQPTDYKNPQYDQNGKLKVLGYESHLEIALQKVQSLLDTNENVMNYIVLFGDGQYWYSDDTDVELTKTRLNSLRNQGINFIAIRYKEKSVDNLYGIKNTIFMKRFVLGDTEVKWTKGWSGVATSNYQKTIEHYYDATSGNVDYNNIFKLVAGEIIDETVEDSVGIYSSLKDYIGSSFSEANTGATAKEFDMGELTLVGKTAGPFYIDIDEYVSDGWHETNSGFRLTYTDINGLEQVFYSDTNPEVYWKSESLNKNACSGEIVSDSTRGSDSEIYDYYEKICDEGYTENNSYVKGFSANIVVNNLPEGATTFDIEDGIGFPISIDLATNVRCHYKFNVSKFTTEYNKAESEINRINNNIAGKNNSLQSARNSLATYQNMPLREIVTCVEVPVPSTSPETGNDTTVDGEGNSESTNDVVTEQRCTTSYVDDYAAIKAQLQAEIETLQKDIANLESQKEPYQDEIERLKGVLITYESFRTGLDISGDLEDYGERFKEQEATAKISYSGSFGSEEVRFQNNEDEPIETIVTCSAPQYMTLAEKNIIVEQVCYANFKKSMELPESCLDMTSAEKVECSGSNTQLDGGNMFFVNLQAVSGEIFVNIPSAGYSSNLNLNTEDCTFTTSDLGIVFRQIDLSDPFLQNYANGRGIGKNYSNSKYNFVNIIKSDIWEQNFMYRYTLSKRNVENIRKDTNEEGVNSYLGRECYFTNNNSFICDFTRNKGQDGTNNQNEWFTVVEIE